MAALRPGGVLVFTTQGESCLAHLELYGADMGAQANWFAQEVARRGMAFRRYTGETENWGITIHARAYWEKTLRQAPFAPWVRLLSYEPRGWDSHQDVWAVQAKVTGDGEV